MDTTWKSQGEKMIPCTAFLSFFFMVHLLAGQQHQSSSNVSGGMMRSSSKLNFELQSLLTCFFGPTKFVASFNAD
jgi:hypothetical protein